MCTCGVAGPQEADASEQSLVALLQGQELQVRSIAFDSPHGADQKRTAFVRLMPPPLPWRSAEQEVRSPGPLWATAQLPHGRGCHLSTRAAAPAAMAQCCRQPWDQPWGEPRTVCRRLGLSVSEIMAMLSEPMLIKLVVSISCHKQRKCLMNRFCSAGG